MKDFDKSFSPSIALGVEAFVQRRYICRLGRLIFLSGLLLVTAGCGGGGAAAPPPAPATPLTWDQGSWDQVTWN